MYDISHFLCFRQQILEKRHCNNLFLLQMNQMTKMSHQYSKSMKILPSSCQTQSSPKINEKSNIPIKLPSIKRTRSQAKNLSNLTSLSTKMSINIKQRPEQTDELQQKLIQKIRQNAKLLATLKYNIIQLKDNVLIKRIMSQISYTSIGPLALELWNWVERFQNFDQELADKIYEVYQIKIQEGFANTMNFINNVCRFFYADYKKKQWNDKDKQITKHYKNIKQSMKNISGRINGLEKADTKLQIISSLAGIKQQCYASKACYMNWKQRAVRMLKQQNIKCHILRAEIFTQGFF